MDVDIESRRPSVAGYVEFEEEREEKSGTSCCCCFFWILAALAVVALLALGFYHFFIKNGQATGEREGTITTPHEGGKPQIVTQQVPVEVQVPVYITQIVIKDREFIGYQYQDNGKWVDYDASISYLIDHHRKYGRREFLISIGHNDQLFSIDLKSKRQYNLEWNRSKQCHVIRSDGKYKRSSKSRAIREVKYTMEQNSELAKIYKFTPNHNWKCLNDGKWQAYDKAISDYIEVTKYLGENGCYVDLGHDILFWIDLNSNVQQSLQYVAGRGHVMNNGKYVRSSTKRPLRRDVGPATHAQVAQHVGGK